MLWLEGVWIGGVFDLPADEPIEWILSLARYLQMYSRGKSKQEVLVQNRSGSAPLFLSKGGRVL